MEETPKTLIEGFIQTAQTHQTAVPKKWRPALTRTPDKLPSPRVSTRSASKRKQSLHLSDKTPRSMIETYMTNANTELLSTARTKRRRTFPAAPVNVTADNFTPRTNIAMLMEQGQEETPYIRPRTRRSSRRSLPALPPNDSIQLLPMSPSIVEEHSGMNSNRRRSRRSNAGSSQANTTAESARKKQRPSSTGPVTNQALEDINDSIHLLPDSSSGDEAMETDDNRKSPMSKSQRSILPSSSQMFNFKEVLSPYRETDEEQDNINTDVSENGLPSSSLEKETSSNSSPMRIVETQEIQDSQNKTKVDHRSRNSSMYIPETQEDSMAGETLGSSPLKPLPSSPTLPTSQSEDGAEADIESGEDEGTDMASTHGNVNGNALEISGSDCYQHRPSVTEMITSVKPLDINENENSNVNSIFDKSTSLVGIEGPDDLVHLGTGTTAEDRLGIDTEDRRGRDTEDRRGRDTEDRRGRDTEDRRGRDTEDRRGRDTEDRRGRDTEDRRGRDTEDRRGRDTEDRRGRDTEDRRGRDTEDRRGRDTEDRRGRDTEDRRGRDTEDRRGRDTEDRRGRDTEDRRGRDTEDRRGRDTGDRRGRDTEDRRGRDTEDRRGRDTEDRRGRDTEDRRGRDTDDRRGRDTDDRRSSDNDERQGGDKETSLVGIEGPDDLVHLGTGTTAEDRLGIDTEDRLGIDTEDRRGRDTEDRRGRDTEDRRDRDTEDRRGRDTEDRRGRDTEDRRGRDTDDRRGRDTEDRRGRDTEDRRGRDTEDRRGRDTEDRRGRDTEDRRGRDTEDRRGRDTEDRRGRDTEDRRGRDTEDRRGRDTEDRRGRDTEDRRGRDTEDRRGRDTEDRRGRDTEDRRGRDTDDRRGRDTDDRRSSDNDERQGGDKETSVQEVEEVDGQDLVDGGDMEADFVLDEESPHIEEEDEPLNKDAEVEDQSEEEETEEMTEDVTENYRLAKTPHLATPRDSQHPVIAPLTDVLKNRNSAPPLRSVNEVLKDSGNTTLGKSKKERYTKTTQRKGKAKPQQTAPLPVSVIKKVFSHYCKMKVSNDVLPALINVTEKFFRQVPTDLEAFCTHAGRKTIDETDVELLMKRQRLIKDNNSLNVLIEENFPLEYRLQLLPMARSGNIIYPK